ncbi:hypothetical protein llap_11274 [Limosa lapponica baueri]|uniref:Uncharacterized protein n=1 Tax=Limosa lapponica baueri TaxID=1758121 RepID=A0A2I0TX71_LIMLA|nr:hypothetical protein llap_11274 [Limosa lapponica baueri]
MSEPETEDFPAGLLDRQGATQSKTSMCQKDKVSITFPQARQKLIFGENFAKKDAMNSSELWYSTVSHDVKHEASVINTDNQTEYTLVNVPKGKENTVRTEEHSEYDYVLIT